MRRVLALVLVSVVTIGALSASRAARTGVAQGPSVTVSPARAVAPAKSIAWLSAVSDPARNRVFVTWARASTKSPHTWVYVAVSQDGGRTFGRPRWVAHDDAAWQPVVRVDRTGRLWSTWTHFDLDPAHLLDPKDEYSNPGWQRVAYSDDQGRTWSHPVNLPTTGRVHTAFGTLAVTPDGRTVTAVWIDYLHTKGQGHDAARYLSATSLDGAKTFGSINQIVRSGCVCCEPFGYAEGKRTAVVFRGWAKGTRAGNVRDIKLSVASARGEWSQPESVHTDDFRLHHCPSVGPAAVVDRAGVTHLVWWTGATGRAGYWYATRSRNGRFSTPVSIEPHPSAPSENNATIALDPYGRVWSATVGHGEYTATGGEDTSPNHITVYTIDTAGRVTEVGRVGTDGAFPQLVAVRGGLAQVWIAGGRIRGRMIGVPR